MWCHCLDCRKHHGAPFHSSAIYPEAAVTLTGDYRSFGDRSFCPIRGSPVSALIDGEIGVNPGALDTPSQFRPTYELWIIRRESWLPPVEGATQFPDNRDGG